MDETEFAINVGRDAQDVFFDKLRTFVVQHETTMEEMEAAFHDGWDLTVWDSLTDTVTVQLGGHNIRRTLADTMGRTKLHNRLFFRITLVMTSMVEEMTALTNECYDNLMSPLAMYGDPAVDSDGVPDEEAQQGLGRLVPFLMDVWNWSRRAEKVVTQMLRHFASLYSPEHTRDKYAPYQGVHFPVVWHSFVNLLGAIVAIEEVMVSHDVIRQGLGVYRRMLGTMAKNTEKYDADEFEIQQFGKLLNKIEHDLLSDGLFIRISSAMFDTPETNVSCNDTFYKVFASQFAEIINHVSSSLSTPREGEARKKVMCICATYVLYFTIFTHRLVKDQSEHKKLVQAVFDFHKRVPVIHLNAANTFKPAQWLARKVPTALALIVKDPVNEGMSSIKSECARVAASATVNINHLTTAVTIWCSQMASSYPTGAGRGRHMIQSLTAFIQRGIVFANEANRLIRNLIFLHQSADLSLTLPLVDVIRQAVILLMQIRSQFHSRVGKIASVFDLLCAQQCFIMQKQLFNMHMKINDSLQTASEGVTDQHTALGQALALLSKPHTPQNVLCLDVVLNICFTRKDCCFDPKEYEETLQAFAVLKKLVNYQKTIEQATNCEFLYWQREAFYPLFFQRLYTNATNSETLPYMLLAMHDCCGAILSARHVENPAESLYAPYAAFVKDTIHEEILQKMFSAIEVDLRLHTHASVLGKPFRTADVDARDLARFTRLPPMRMFGEYLHIASVVEDYLDAQFYNLNALHPNDWKTYEEMRTLAHDRYSLTLSEGFLPGSIVDQGLDVLVITKNIHVFVANYTYNMNEQVFVQRPSITESKHLHTLAVRHVTNSIRTHGTGIMNTTVNYVFRYLVKKLAILSQFLYDDHVKSRLMKDIKYFAGAKDSLDRTYPIARADKYCAEIRKLGVTEDGKTYLDQVRVVVTEIGNALGYMRMVRSGGLRAVANAAVFIPEMDQLPHLERCIDPKARREDDPIDEDELDLMESDEDEEAPPPPVQQCTASAIHVVDDVMYGMKKRLSQGSDYFRVLEEAIAKKIVDPEKYGHLKNFYMIVPSMSISFVEHMVNQKEQLLKKNKEGLFTDDGFALGCVFLLSLFHIHDDWDGLHWFEGVTNHYVNRKKEMDEGIAKRKASKKEKKSDPSALGEGEINSMQLTLTMVESCLREYSSLGAAFNSSKVFFKYRPQEEEGTEETENDDDDE